MQVSVAERKRDRPYAGRPFFCVARLELDYRRAISEAYCRRLTLMGRSEGGCVAKKRITCQCPSVDGSVRFVCSCLALRERNRKERREKRCAISDGVVESRLFKIRRALRDGSTRVVVPCFRTARHSARLGRGGYEFIEICRPRRRGVLPRAIEGRRVLPRCDVRKRGVKIARDESICSFRSRCNVKRRKRILTLAMAVDRRLPAKESQQRGTADDNKSCAINYAR